MISDIHDIMCKPHLTIIFKEHGWEPACVKSSSVEKLIEHGWASCCDSIHEKTMKENAVPSQKIFFTLQEDKVGTLDMKVFDAGPKMT